MPPQMNDEDENMLTKKQFDILEAYANHGSLTQREVAEITDQSVGNVNRLVKEMAGFIQNGRITADGLTALDPYRVKRAIFLAAGLGARLFPITLNTPKPLIRVKGKRIIDGLLDECIALGIDEIYIVRGYLAEQFDQLKYKYPSVQFLENPNFNQTNNISSAMCARYLLSNAYVFESDLIIRSGLLRKYHYNSDFLACYKERVDDWCFEVKNGIITGERLGAFNAWHNCGISYWDEDDGRKLTEHIKAAYEQPGGKELFWEQVPLDVFKKSYSVAVQECSEQDVVEIDTYNELKEQDITYNV